jgi:hypothetical protein
MKMWRFENDCFLVEFVIFFEGFVVKNPVNHKNHGSDE